MARTAAFIVTVLQVIGVASAHYARVTLKGLGTYQGIKSADGKVSSFLGIPFAQSPIGNRRFRQAVPATRFNGVRNATIFGPGCIQPPFIDPAVRSAWPPEIQSWYYDGGWASNLEVPAEMQSEDCLTLNVFKPTSATERSRLPVLVFIHGGGSVSGAAYPLDGARFVRRSIKIHEPVVFVSIQYRLGVFGYLGGEQVLDQGIANLGLYDQQLALRFVQQHISKLGGEPSKVTISGQSAGAQSVAAQLLAGHQRPLFRAAWMVSGAVTPAGAVTSPIAQRAFNMITAAVNCSTAPDTLTCLRGTPAPALLAAAAPFRGAFATSFRGPDGLKMTDRPQAMLRQGKYARVPVVQGEVDDEGTFFAVSAPAASQLAAENVLAFVNASHYAGQLSASDIAGLATACPADDDHRSPFGGAPVANFGPAFGYMAALRGDCLFTSARRTFLNYTSATQPVYNYHYKRNKGVYQSLGAFHGIELFLELFTPELSTEGGDYLRRLLAFVSHLSPNYPGALHWPKYDRVQRKSLVFGEGTYASIERDEYRVNGSTYLQSLYDKYPI